MLEVVINVGSCATSIVSTVLACALAFRNWAQRGTKTVWFSGFHYRQTVMVDSVYAQLLGQPLTAKAVSALVF